MVKAGMKQPFRPAHPAELGYAMPAEWAPHEATWLAWPHNPTDWPGKIEAIHWVYGEIVRALAPGEKLYILVNGAAHEGKARRILERVAVPPSRVRFFRVPTNRGWTRDFGPICVTKPGARAAVKFRFNAWARYPDWHKDNRAAETVARQLRLPVLPAVWQGRPFVLEGGAIDVNGQGTLLTTEECLLDRKQQVRNPGLSRGETEAALRAFLGVQNILWLGRGIAGDDTHGHVDDFCRFVNPTTVVLCREADSRDANYRPLEENRERLEGMRLEDGSRVQVVELPMPAPLWFDGQRLPASYANFYIGNEVVLVPTFNDPKDRVALGQFEELFPGRSVVGVHAVDLVWGFGTIHCLSQQLPKKPD